MFYRFRSESNVTHVTDITGPHRELVHGINRVLTQSENAGRGRCPISRRPPVFGRLVLRVKERLLRCLDRIQATVFTVASARRCLYRMLKFIDRLSEPERGSHEAELRLGGNAKFIYGDVQGSNLHSDHEDESMQCLSVPPARCFLYEFTRIVCQR